MSEERDLATRVTHLEVALAHQQRDYDRTQFETFLDSLDLRTGPSEAGGQVWVVDRSNRLIAAACVVVPAPLSDVSK